MRLLLIGWLDLVADVCDHLVGVLAPKSKARLVRKAEVSPNGRATAVMYHHRTGRDR